ncbi:MAG: hypothetical protein OEL75_01685 [Kiritimatiellaceae bacterium]|nr:hypothetical protein [Kiritimatiellaceae bacterium]
MKRLFLILCLSASGFAETLPPAPQILEAARAQLPPHPVVMKGTLKQRAANGFVKQKLKVEMKLDWNAVTPNAEYKISNSKTKTVQSLKIEWKDGEAEYSFSKNGEKEEFIPHAEIENMGVTWSDLSFSFLWSPDAETLRTEKKFGKDYFVISIPRPNDHQLILKIEQKTGRMKGAEERDANGKRAKVIKVVSVKDFDGLWMVKDLDIDQPEKDSFVRLRIDSLE